MITAAINLDFLPLFFFVFLCSVLEVFIARAMEGFRFIEIEEHLEEQFDDEEEGFDDEEDVGGLISAGVIPFMVPDYNFEDDDDDEEEEEYQEEEEEEFITEEDDEEEEEEDEEEDDNEEGYEEEEEEGEGLIPPQMTSPRVSSWISVGRTLQRPVVINDGLADGLNDSESCERKPGNQENGRGNGGKGELSRGEIDGLFCPICFEAWTSGGEHQLCCLPCGHMYGLSCINKWLQRCRSSGKCPQCNSLCTLKDVRVLYATRLCVADEELQKRVRVLEAKCAYLEQEVSSQAAPLKPEELIDQICSNPTHVRRLATALAELHQQQNFP